MTESKLPGNDLFWKTLKGLEELDSPRTLQGLCHELHVPEPVIYRVVHFLKIMGIEFNVHTSEKGVIIGPDPKNKHKSRVYIEMGITEWLAFQAHFPVIDIVENSVAHKLVVNKLSEAEKNFCDLDFFEAYATLSIEEDRETSEGIPDDLRTNLGLIGQAILEQKCLQITLNNGEVEDFYPHRMALINGKRILVGEPTANPCLSYFEIQDIRHVILMEYETFIPTLSRSDIQEFLDGLKEISDEHVRLILKIHGRDPQVMDPFQYYLGNPAVIQNRKNETIWAATVEPNEELLQWLVDLGDNVEIVDPEHMKSHLANYKESLKKGAA
jgi:hypothetical protein